MWDGFTGRVRKVFGRRRPWEGGQPRGACEDVMQIGEEEESADSETRRIASGCGHHSDPSSLQHVFLAGGLESHGGTS